MAEEMIYLLGIDIGTTGTKCSVYLSNGKIVASAYTEYAMIHPKDNWTEQDPHNWWNAVVQNLNDLFINKNLDSSKIKSIGLSCTNAVTLVDINGEPIYNAIGHQDRRSSNQVLWLKNHMNENEVINISGNRIAMGSFFLPSVRWIIDNYPAAFKKAYKLLMPSGYIIYKLTNVFSINKPRASFSLLYDLEHRNWNKKLINDAQIPYYILPDIFNPTDIVGRVTKEAAELTGLYPGTPVTAGCLDTVVSTLASGAVECGDIALTIGSSARICYISDHPAEDHRLLSACSPYDGLFTIVQSTDNAGVSLRWFRDTFGKSVEKEANKKKMSIYEYLDINAQNIPVGSNGLIYLPYLNGEKSPIWNPNAKGVFFGLTLNTSYYSFVRAIMEGVAFSIRDCLDQMTYKPNNSKPIPMGGGSSKSVLWCQIFADILNRPIIQLENAETETLGDMIIAAQGIQSASINKYFGKEQAKKGNILYPNGQNVELYNKLFIKYRNLYLHTKDLM